MSIPENHVVAEGRTLRAAIDAAATTLGVPAGAVDHKIDMAHFRSAGGGTAGAETVKIFAWAKDVKSFAAAQAGEEWVKGMLAAMGREGTVRGEMRGDAAVVFVDVGEHARHLVGRGGSTLRSIQHVLERSVGPKFPGTGFRIDVARGPEDEGRERRDDRGGDRDRGGFRGDRGDRGGDRGGFRGGDRGDRPRFRDDRGPRRDGPRRDNDSEDLKRLARKLAQKVLETGDPEVIRRELNSYDRRIVHIEVAEVGGVKSRSVGEGHDRRVEIYRGDGSEEDAG